MPVTKILNPRADYQTWTTASGLAQGDILDVEGSLGRPAKYISIEAVSATSVVRFNVCHKIYGNHEGVGNIPYLGADAAFWQSPVLIDEVEVTKPNIVVEGGVNMVWNNEIAVSDIKLVTVSGQLSIITA